MGRRAARAAAAGLLATATARLVAFGGKQGTVYLLDRDTLTAGACGPLKVFGPYSERYRQGDWAKMRSTPAIAHEVVYVGTDRVQAFGLRSD